MPPFGQSIKQKFYIIRNNPVATAPLEFTESSFGQCCVVIKALAETSYSSDFYNDFHSPLFFWGEGFTTADLKLQKKVSGTWTNVATLNVNTWGTAYTFGNVEFQPGVYTNIYGESGVGYKLEWKEVLNDGALGEGNYRFKSTGTALIGAAQVDKYSMEFCLEAYTEARADETTRFEWWTNGTIGNPDDDQLKRDYGSLNWNNQLRIPDSFFGNPGSTFEREFNKYQNGAKVWLADSQVEEYEFKTGLIDNDLHRYIKIDILQGDEIRITDYNIHNPTRHQNRFVIPISNYEPAWIIGSMLAPVEVKFAQRFQNHVHKRN